ncbi:hypothetical protein A2U01_0098540, partial [Trifolium medium]|nr:hypothetical protein [Trifolium medium]
MREQGGRDLGRNGSRKGSEKIQVRKGEGEKNVRGVSRGVVAGRTEVVVTREQEAE